MAGAVGLGALVHPGAQTGWVPRADALHAPEDESRITVRHGPSTSIERHIMFTALAPLAAAPIGPWAGGYGPGPFFLLIPLVWIVVIVGLLAFFGRRARRRFGAGGAPWAAGHGAEATLAERFAQGDIEEVEYRARLEVLRANRPPLR